MKNASEMPRAYMTPSETRRCNGRIVDTAALFLNFAADSIPIESVDEIASDCGVTREYAYAEMIAARFGIDSGGRDRAFFRNYVLPMMNELDASVFRADPFYKNVSFPEAELGKWRFKKDLLKAGEAFVCRDFLVTDDGRMIPQLGFFTEHFEYPAVYENGREWMTLMPNETVTTLPAVAASRGKVLTYGLGLGYFAYMASNREEVASVDVVERSEELIGLFREHILPQFQRKDKIRLICSDAFDYAEKTAPAEKYDFIFTDIWHDAGDGRDLYLKMKEYEKYSPHSEHAYWLEDTLKCYLDADLWP